MINTIKRYLRERAGGYLEYNKQIRANGEARIVSLNRSISDAGKSWLGDYILKHNLLNGSSKSISIGSLYGPRSVLGWSKADVRIFFSGENLHLARWSHYADYMLSGPNPFDLGLGFDIFEDEHYLRFPLWLMYLFTPEVTEDDIRSVCKQLRFQIPDHRDKFCALISRWDPNGIRGNIHSSLASIGQIDCPSAFLHNDDSLKSVFNDIKVDYLKQFRFNICPENSNALGYITEKIFESISAGCIPIYYGSYGQPESQIINQKAVIHWDEKGDNTAAISLIRELEGNDAAYDEFFAQPRFTDGAEDWIISKFAELDVKIKELLK